MSYSFDRTFPDTTLEEMDPKVRAALKDAGFGIMTEIDVQAKLKAKLDHDMPGYRILGACNPAIALSVIEAEPGIGTMLPCNVLLREVDGGVIVSMIDPQASMAAVKNDALHKILGEVGAQLSKALAAI